MTEKSDFHNITKSNTVFGGIKLFQVIISFAKTKIVAIILGPSGVGIEALLVNALNTFHQFSSFGIYQSSVREISIKESLVEKKNVITTLNYLSFFLGLISSLLFILFAKKISFIIFNSNDYELFVKLSALSLIFMSISNAQISILQALQRVTLLAKASLVGAMISLAISFPLYYFLNIKAIPIVLVVSNVFTSMIYLYISSRDRKIYGFSISLNDFRRTSNPILHLGFTLMFSNVIMTLFALGTNLFIAKYGNNSEVGFFHASNVLTYSAINIIISILTSDYYPRLAKNIFDKKKIEDIVNIQIELLLLMLTPIISILLIFPDVLIRLLYSPEFLDISPVMQLMSISLFFRTIWHAMSFIILARGDKQIYFFYDAILANGFFFTCNIFGYYSGGLKGIGLSYFASSIIIMTLLLVVVKKKYKYRIYKHTANTAARLFIISFIIFVINYFDVSYKLYGNILLLSLMVTLIAIKINNKTLFVKKIRIKIQKWLG